MFFLTTWAVGQCPQRSFGQWPLMQAELWLFSRGSIHKTCFLRALESHTEEVLFSGGQDHHWPKQNPWLKWPPTDPFFHTGEVPSKPVLLCLSRQSVYSASTEAKCHKGIWNQGHIITEKKKKRRNGQLTGKITSWFNMTLNAKYPDLIGCHSFQIHVTLIRRECSAVTSSRKLFCS